MISIKHKELFDLLHARTKEGNIEWIETAVKGTYSASFSAHTVAITQIFNSDSPDDTEPTIRLVIRNDAGDAIESFTDAHVGALVTNDSARFAFYRKCEELYALAERQALGTEKALDSILKELKDIIPF